MVRAKNKKKPTKKRRTETKSTTEQEQEPVDDLSVPSEEVEEVEEVEETEEIDIDAIIQDLSDLKVEPYLKFGLFGEPGAGKTTLACQFPRPILLDVDKGHLSVIGLKGKRIPINTCDHLLAAYEWLMRHLDDFDTVIIDTLTELQYMNLAEVTKNAFMRDTTGKRIDDLDASLKDWGKNTEWMRRVIRAFKGLDKHVIFICHELEAQDEDTKIWHIRAALTPKLAISFIGACDLVGYLSVDTERITEEGEALRILHIAPGEGLKTKFRIRRHEGLPTPTELEDPSYSDIIGTLFPEFTE